MPSWEALLPFILGVLILQVSPGPDMLLVLERGISNGRRIAFSTIAGIILIAGATQLALLVLGLGTLASQTPAAMRALQSVGAGYLLYLGVRMMTTRFSILESAPVRFIDTRTALMEGALSSLTNPKSILFLFVFLPQFASPSAGPIWQQMLILGAIHKLAGLVTLSSIALAADRIGRWTRKWPMLLPLQRNCCGALMVVISLGMASQAFFAN